MEKMDNHELISALADGQLRGGELARAVALVAADRSGRSTWQAYQTVGEVLRSGQAAAGTDTEAFLARLQMKLQAEALPAAAAAAEPALAVVARPQPPANDWLWKMVAGVASVAAVAAIGWNMAAPALAPATQPQLAAAPAPAAATAAIAPEAGVQQAAMIRDPRLDQLLAAHRQLGGATAWQSTSGFLRNATFEGPVR
ncbi:anti-anti-sigma factor [Caenimonas sedimenti]|uniref:Anti-anti-sigma factor n=1 Tax=Caenimonas sedimenti TaxID=2596921 RepID=A0A562ZKB4_9BURK|nr:RseA family anti-sigma factor [Caenimonas sedimenti]TWO68933.1 anti-anti-sigma factor [Caenimonas sedimenti]